MENLKLLGQFDWSMTSLGAFEQWPVERRAIVKTVLASTFPMLLALGDDLVQIYNDGYNEILGDKHPEAFGAPAAESWPEIWDFLEPAMARVRAEKKPAHFTDHLLPLRKTANIEECHFSFCYSPILLSDGSVDGVMSTAMETTEQAIAKRRRHLTALVIEPASDDPQPISIKLWEVLEANDLDAKAALLFKGTPQADSVGWAMRCDEEISSIILSSVKPTHLRSRWGVIALNQHHCRSDYAEFLAHVTFTAADGVSQKTLVLWPSALVTESSVLDLLPKLERELQLATRQLVHLGRIKDELAESGLLYRFLFENTLDGVVYSSLGPDDDAPDTTIAVNQAACDMLGYQASELVGMHRDDFFFAEDDQLASAIAERAQECVFKGDLVFRHKSGRPVRLGVTSLLANLESGQRRSISIWRDWAQESNVERERAERSRLETIAQMTGGISHDFNNLLTVIQSAAEHLDASVTDAEHKDVISDILTASSRAANLTSQLLSYAGRQNLRPQSVEVNSAIKEIERLVQTVIGKDMAVQYDYSRRNLAAELDLAQLTSALVNMIKNASDAISGRGRIIVSTRLEQDETILKGLSLEPGKYVRISVKDDGVGIPAKLLQRVFDPYFTTKSDHGGSGLGLSMVQGFARQSGGDVSVASAPGTGTTISLFIPCGSGSSLPRSKPIAGQPVASRRGVDVLVVEDDPLVRRQVSRILKSMGMTFIEAGSGSEGIDLLRNRPRLVLTDLAMPGERTGGDVIEACRRSDPVVPVIVISGFAADPRWKTAPFEANDLLAKPFSQRQLVSAITKILN